MSTHESTGYDNLGVSGIGQKKLLEEIKSDEHWVCWQYQCRECWTIYDQKMGDCPASDCDGKVTKVPVDPETGSMARSNDSSTWASYDTAVDYDTDSDDTQGIGFMFSEDHPVMGVDLDDAVVDGELTEWAEEIVVKLDGSYVEVSPSGTGLHALVWATLPPGGSRKTLESNESHEYDGPGEVEMYDSGRFFTVSFDHVEGTETSLTYQQPAIEEIHETFIIDDTEQHETPNNSPGNTDIDLDLDEEELLEKAKEDPKFKRLWNGDTSMHEGDNSKADLALASKLAFWTGCDAEMMDSMFRQSGLMRPKWDADRGDTTYGEMTIDEAIDGTTDVYDPEYASGSPSEDDEPELPDDVNITVKDGKYGYMALDGDITDPDTEPVFNEVTNFTFNKKEILHEDGQEFAKLEIQPANGENFTELVKPTAFNNPRDFTANVCTRFSTSFSGSSQTLPELRKIVFAQDAPERTATKQIGLHDNDFVLPSETVSANETHSYTYRESGSAVAENIRVSDLDYDLDQVKQALELLPETRPYERWLPVVGFHYASLLAPKIHDWEGELPLCSVTGESGSGKSASIRTLSKAFGSDGTSLSIDTTEFSLVKHFSASSSIPIWYDEYKVNEIADYKLDRFHKFIRKNTNGGMETRGTQSLREEKYRLEAPVVVSGEQRIQGSAEHRRAVLSQFLKTTVDDPEYKDAFSELESLELDNHAQFAIESILDFVSDEEMDLERIWINSREHVEDLVTNDLGDLEITGLTMIHFGYLIYQSICERADVSPLVTDSDADDAVVYVASQKGAQNRTTHVDELMTQVARCMDNNKLQSVQQAPKRGDYKIINVGDDDEEIRLKFNRAFPEVSKYIREYDINVDLLSDEDYKDRFGDLENDDNSYIVAASKQTRGLNRCVAIDPKAMEKQLDVDLEDVRQDHHRG